MKSKLSEFQRDLWDGYTIEEALQRHELTFKEAWDNLPKTQTKPRRRRRRRRR